MITRRAFLAALAALPVVGRLVPEPWYIETTIGTSGTSAKAMLAEMNADAIVVIRAYEDRYNRRLRSAETSLDADIQREYNRIKSERMGRLFPS